MSFLPEQKMQGFRMSGVPAADLWTLRLYVAGHAPRSLRAVVNTEKLCVETLQGRYRLEVIDLYQFPHLAQDAQVVAVPALVRRLPEPLRMVIGDMSDTHRVLAGLDLSCGSDRPDPRG
jgi:circadian clock protein KaiB